MPSVHFSVLSTGVSVSSPLGIIGLTIFLQNARVKKLYLVVQWSFLES